MRNRRIGHQIRKCLETLEGRLTVFRNPKNLNSLEHSETHIQSNQSTQRTNIDFFRLKYCLTMYQPGHQGQKVLALGKLPPASLLVG